MANINISVEQFICETPIFINAEWIGTGLLFELQWSSLGDVYINYDSNTYMELHMEIKDVQTSTIAYSDIIDYSAPFNTNNYIVDVSNYYPGLSSKFSVTFLLTLKNDGCDNFDNFVAPITYP